MTGYRPNVCIAVRRPDTGLFLLCHRKGFPANAGWQFPQGGIHRGKELVSEMRRELAEETGLHDVSVAMVTKNSYRYEFPAGAHKHRRYKGQVQRWVLVDYVGPEDSLDFSREPAEFDSYCWATAQTALDRIVNFKKHTYTRAMTDLGIIHNLGK